MLRLLAGVNTDPFVSAYADKNSAITNCYLDAPSVQNAPNKSFHFDNYQLIAKSRPYGRGRGYSGSYRGWLMQFERDF